MRLNPLRAIIGARDASDASTPTDRGAGFDFPLWRAYVLLDHGQLEVIVDRILLVHGHHVEPTDISCTMCRLPVRRMDKTHLFCTAGCDARVTAEEAGPDARLVPARRLPDDGVRERRFEVQGRFGADEIQAISECLHTARELVKQRNMEERATDAHVTDLYDQVRLLQSPDARAGMAGAYWVLLEIDESGEQPSAPQVSVRRTAPGRWNGVEVESWPLHGVHSTWERTPGAADRRRDEAAVDQAARRVAELMGERYRPKYARLRSSLSSNSLAGPSSTTSPVEST